MLLELGLSYSEIKALTFEEELFFVEAYLAFNDKKYGTNNGNRNKKGKTQEYKSQSQYKKEIEDLRNQRNK